MASFDLVFRFNSVLGAAHKRLPQLRGIVQCGLFRTRGVLQMWTSALFGAKIIWFSKFMVYPHRQGKGLSQSDILRTRGKGVSFSRFCADIFFGRPLTICNLWDINAIDKLKHKRDLETLWMLPKCTVFFVI